MRWVVDKRKSCCESSALVGVESNVHVLGPVAVGQLKAPDGLILPDFGGGHLLRSPCGGQEEGPRVIAAAAAAGWSLLLVYAQLLSPAMRV